MVKKTYNLIRYFLRKISAHKVGAFSAEGAFFIMISIFPIIILLLSLIRFLPFDQEQILDFLSNVFPYEVNNFLRKFISEVTLYASNAVTIFSAGGVLWSASKGVYAIVGGLNSVFEQRETRHFFRVRFLSIIYTLSFILMFAMSFLILVLGRNILAIVAKNFPYTPLIYVMMSLRYLIGFCLLVLFFILIYKFLPAGKRKLSTQIPGAIIAAVGWISFSFIFSFYMDNFSDYANIYGSLTAVVLLMLWLYSCMYILFFGAELNLYYQKKILLQT